MEYTTADYEAALSFVIREEQASYPEQVVQQFWYDYGPETGPLRTVEGQALEVLSPGWWNHCAGPDFQGAQLRFNDTLYTGDVEVHIDQVYWRQHGHDRDPRYNNVLLHVVLNAPPEGGAAFTSGGRKLPHLVLGPLCGDAKDGSLRPLEDVESHPELRPRCHGSCNRFVADGHPETLTDFLRLSGDWRLLNKTRYVEERMARVGGDQAAWELVARALGYRPFADNLERLARALPYERACQLAQQQPHLLEAALLRLAGLLPLDASVEDLPPHGKRLIELCARWLPQMNALDVVWPLSGVRPNNYPARRLSGLAHLMGRVGRDGLAATLDRLWKTHEKPLDLRRAFEGLFPPAMGFWSTHYGFERPPMGKPNAPVGAGRVRSIIGNVIVPFAMARARSAGDRTWEEQVWRFFRALPVEPDNHVYQRMVPRVLSDHRFRFTFQTQQGLLQLHEDWCKTNPSCRNCALLAYLEGRSR